MEQQLQGKLARHLREDNLEEWDGFPELMWSLGFEMDCCRSFDEYQVNAA